MQGFGSAGLQLPLCWPHITTNSRAQYTDDTGAIMLPSVADGPLFSNATDRPADFAVATVRREKASAVGRGG